MLALLLSLLSVAPRPTVPAPAPDGFSVEKLAEGVYAVVRDEPPQSLFRGAMVRLSGESP